MDVINFDNVIDLDNANIPNAIQDVVVVHDVDGAVPEDAVPPAVPDVAALWQPIDAAAPAADAAPPPWVAAAPPPPDVAPPAPPPPPPPPHVPMSYVDAFRVIRRFRRDAAARENGVPQRALRNAMCQIVRELAITPFFHIFANEVLPSFYNSLRDSVWSRVGRPDSTPQLLAIRFESRRVFLPMILDQLAREIAIAKIAVDMKLRQRMHEYYNTAAAVEEASRQLIAERGYGHVAKLVLNNCMMVDIRLHIEPIFQIIINRLDARVRNLPSPTEYYIFNQAGYVEPERQRAFESVMRNIYAPSAERAAAIAAAAAMEAAAAPPPPPAAAAVEPPPPQRRYQARRRNAAAAAAQQPQPAAVDVDDDVAPPPVVVAAAALPAAQRREAARRRNRAVMAAARERLVARHAAAARPPAAAPPAAAAVAVVDEMGFAIRPIRYQADDGFVPPPQSLPQIKPLTDEQIEELALRATAAAAAGPPPDGPPGAVSDHQPHEFGGVVRSVVDNVTTLCCYVCRDVPDSKAIICSHGHVVCEICFEHLVNISCNTTSSDFNGHAWRENEGFVRCRGGDDGPPCKMLFTEDVIIAAAAGGGGGGGGGGGRVGIVKLFYDSRMRYLALIADDHRTASARAAVASAIRNYEHLISSSSDMKDHIISSHIRTIQENILVKRCPRCRAPYLEYKGCSAVKCNCGSYFCGLCMLFSSPDSHQTHMHVKDACRLNPSPGTSYAFISPAVKSRIDQGRADRVVEYIHHSVPTELKIDVAFAIGRDMSDNQLPMQELNAYIMRLSGVAV